MLEEEEDERADDRDNDEMQVSDSDKEDAAPRADDGRKRKIQCSGQPQSF